MGGAGEGFKTADRWGSLVLAPEVIFSVPNGNADRRSKKKWREINICMCGVAYSGLILPSAIDTKQQRKRGHISDPLNGYRSGARDAH